MPHWNDTFDENTDWADAREDSGDGTPGVYRMFVRAVNERLEALGATLPLIGDDGSPGLIPEVTPEQASVPRDAWEDLLTARQTRSRPGGYANRYGWAMLQRVVDLIAGGFADPDSLPLISPTYALQPLRRNGSALGYPFSADPPEIKFPAPNGWTRKRGRFITALSIPGTAGQRARFRALNWVNTQTFTQVDPWDNTTVFPTTPVDEFPLSGKFFDHDGTAWQLSDDQISEEDEQVSYGLACEHDRFGPWFLNELRDAINSLTWTFCGRRETVFGDPYFTATSTVPLMTPDYSQKLGWPGNSYRNYWRNGRQRSAGGGGFTYGEAKINAVAAWGAATVQTQNIPPVAYSELFNVLGPNASLIRAEATHYAFELPATVNGVAANAELAFYEMPLAYGVFSDSGDPVVEDTWVNNANVDQAGATAVDGPHIGDADVMPDRWPAAAPGRLGYIFDGITLAGPPPSTYSFVIAKWDRVFQYTAITP